MTNITMINNVSKTRLRDRVNHRELYTYQTSYVQTELTSIRALYVFNNIQYASDPYIRVCMILYSFLFFYFFFALVVLQTSINARFVWERTRVSETLNGHSYKTPLRAIVVEKNLIKKRKKNHYFINYTVV